MKSIEMVLDLQYGSTGKGLLAGVLATTGHHDTIMTAWGPNAGHTFIDAGGNKYVHIMLANGVVAPGVKRVMIGPGSVLDLDILSREILAVKDIILKNRTTIYIHPHAAVVTDEDREAEQVKMTAIGSTKKGVGAAMASKIARQPGRPTVAKDFADHPLFQAVDSCVVLLEHPTDWMHIYQLADKILIEGAQGFGLSIHHGFYPYTTSRDVTPAQILADCGVPMQDARHVIVYGTCRTYPIRVANRYEDGRQVGYSGPGFDDQREINWSDIGREAELTTVTKLPRRLFSFSEQQMEFACSICSPDIIFLNFVNYLTEFEQFEKIDDFLYGPRVSGRRKISVVYGTGPTAHDVHLNMWGNARKKWADLQYRLAK